MATLPAGWEAVRFLFDHGSLMRSPDGRSMY
jgi:hypothetical protein